MNLKDSMKDFICGCVSGWTQVFVMQPFEIVKVRLVNQSYFCPQYKGMVDCFKTIQHQQGFLAFYKGSTSPLLGIGAQVALQFGSNGLIKRVLTNYQNQGRLGQELPTLNIVFLSGLLTGIPSALAVTPVDRTRILMQLQKGNDANNRYHSSLDAGKILFKKQGLKGLYLGFQTTLIRQVLALSVFFSSYEYCMRYMSGINQTTSKAHILGAFFAGGIAGSASWLLTYPIDYVKTLIQSQTQPRQKFNSAIHCALSQYRAEGYKTFFKGLGVTMARAFPVNGAGFLAFEATMRMTGRQQTSDDM